MADASFGGDRDGVAVKLAIAAASLQPGTVFGPEHPGWREYSDLSFAEFVDLGGVRQPLQQPIHDWYYQAGPQDPGEVEIAGWHVARKLPLHDVVSFPAYCLVCGSTELSRSPVIAVATRSCEMGEHIVAESALGTRMVSQRHFCEFVTAMELPYCDAHRPEDGADSVATLLDRDQAATDFLDVALPTGSTVHRADGLDIVRNGVNIEFSDVWKGVRQEDVWDVIDGLAVDSDHQTDWERFFHMGDMAGGGSLCPLLFFAFSFRNDSYRQEFIQANCTSFETCMTLDLNRVFTAPDPTEDALFKRQTRGSQTERTVVKEWGKRSNQSVELTYQSGNVGERLDLVLHVRPLSGHGDPTSRHSEPSAPNMAESFARIEHQPRRFDLTGHLKNPKIGPMLVISIRALRKGNLRLTDEDLSTLIEMCKADMPLRKVGRWSIQIPIESANPEAILRVLDWVVDRLDLRNEGLR